MDTPAEPATDNPLEPASGMLPHLGLLRFAGPDAASFLQGQVSNDTRRLGTQAPLLAAYSTPQGRVVAVMHMLPHSSGIIALLPRELIQPVLERLRKYVLRSKVTIEDLSAQFACFGLHAAGAHEAPDLCFEGSPLRDRERHYAERGGIGIARVGADARYWVVGRIEAVASLGPRTDALHGPDSNRVERDWRLADIRSGLPQVYAATSELFVAQMLNLDLIDGISFTKGCFTGQEIVARTQHLGRIKRRMHRLRLPAGTWSIGQALRFTDGRGGRLTELAESGMGFEALAVLNTDASTSGAGDPAGPSEAAPGGGDIEAVELPLPYRLGPAAGSPTA
jgi:folate-binding protein YgfZ